MQWSWIIPAASLAWDFANVKLPLTLSQSQAMKWCGSGPLYALYSTISALSSYNISSSEILEIRNIYKGIGSTRRLIGSSSEELEASLVNALRLLMLNTTLQRQLNTTLQRQRILQTAATPEALLSKAVSPLNAILAISPIMSEFLATVDSDLSTSTRVQIYSERLCRLVDAEYSVIQGSALPYSCAILDLIHTAIICRDNLDIVSASCPVGKHSIPSFPKTLCSITPSDLVRYIDSKSGGDRPPLVFDWNEPDIYIDVNLTQFSNDIPDYIPETIRDRELIVYLALFRANELLSAMVDYDFDRCFVMNDELSSFIPGWNTELLITIQEPTSSLQNKYRPVPYGVILEDSQNACHFAIGTRGARTRLEWTLAFDTSSTFEGYHRGVHTISQAVLPLIQNFINRKVDCNACNSKFTFFGHSLGGGVAANLALHFAQYASTSCGLKSPEIQLVVFGPIKAVKSPGIELLKKKVNFRTLIDLSDPLYYIPCNSKHGAPRCPSRLPNIIHAGAFESHGTDTYQAYPGQILVSSS